MSNKPILHKTIPYIDNFASVEDAFNYMAKILNSSFQSPDVATSESTLISPITLDGVEVSSAYSAGIGGAVISITLNHNLGVTPSGWIIKDISHGGISAGNSLSIGRTSWTTTQITINITVTQSISGNLKILVLR